MFNVYKQRERKKHKNYKNYWRLIFIYQAKSMLDQFNLLIIQIEIENKQNLIGEVSVEKERIIRALYA